jgi:hypothetical protein
MDILISLFGLLVFGTLIYYCNEIARNASLKGGSYPVWFIATFFLWFILIPIHINEKGKS